MSPIVSSECSRPMDLQASYAWCQQFSRRAASNFYYAFYLLPRPKRQSMCALYAFLRHADDLGDSQRPVGERRASLVELRTSLRRALDGQFDGPMYPALADTARRHAIPQDYLFDAIDGVEMDLDNRGFETFDELEVYCYRVASVVGMACVHIWGFRSQAALEPARQCGLAFQLTNILRDLKEDAQNGRIYLPREDLLRCNYSAEDLRRGVSDERFEALMQLQIGRAERLYDAAAGLAAHLYWDGRRVLHCMLATYRGLLDQIKRRRIDVFRHRVHLSLWDKCSITARSIVPPPHSRWPARKTPIAMR